MEHHCDRSYSYSYMEAIKDQSLWNWIKIWGIIIFSPSQRAPDPLRNENRLKWMRKCINERRLVRIYTGLYRGESVFDEGLPVRVFRFIRGLYHVKGGGMVSHHIFCVTQHMCKITWKQVSSEYCSAKHRQINY